MISSILLAGRPPQAPQLAAAPPARPGTVPGPMSSTDSVDVRSPRHIDSPQKAASLPALNAAVVASVVPYAVAATIGGQAMQASLHLKLGNTEGDVVYRMDDPAHPSLQAVGTLDDHTFKETWTLEDAGLHIVGTYGTAPEELRLSRDAGGYRLDGKIGDYAVAQRVTWEPSSHKVTFDGTLDGLPYTQTVTVENNPSMPEADAHGALGTDATSIGWMAMPHPAIGTVDVSADGTLIGQPLEMEGTVTTMAPGTHPQMNLQGIMEVDGSTTGTVKPAQPSHWQLRFVDANTHVPVVDFEQDHEKYMHMVVVSRDLSTFAHVHPTYDPTMGHFDIDINKASSDPDNADTTHAVTKAGPVMVWTEMKPKDQDVMTRAFTLTADGVENPQPIVPDTVQPDGTIQKYFTADGQLGHAGDQYQITLSVERMPGMIHLNYHLRQAEQKDGVTSYTDVTDLQPWLGMMGHAIVIGAAGNSVDTKFFAHLHAGHDDLRHPSTGPDEMFMISAPLPPAGVYKIWGQFKHHDRVLTLPFVFSLEEQT